MTGLVLLSCQKEVTLTVSPTSLYFKDASAVKTVSVSCSDSWTVEAPEWLLCNPTAGIANGTVEVSINDDSGFRQNGAITFYAGELVQTVQVKVDGSDFFISSDSFRFDENGTPLTAIIRSRYPWEISLSPEAAWLEIEPMSGQAGETEITLTPKPLTDRNPRSEQIVDVKYGNKFTMFVVSQTLPNSAPSSPQIISPAEGEVVGISTEFRWTASEDADNDILTYEISVTGDNGKTWIIAKTEETNVKLPELLPVSADCEWKITVSDPFGGTAETQAVSFKTNDEGAWKERECRIIQEASAGAPKPVNLVILGDGYMAEDYLEGGKFEQDMTKACNEFFNLEPFREYRDYFRVSAVAAYSEERGATVKNNIPEIPDLAGGCPAQTRNTAFNCTLTGKGSTETYIPSGYDKVFEYAKEVPGIDDNELPKTAVLLMINLDVYAGTCVSFRNGQSVAMCPAGYNTFATVVNHECGGHGFGRLLDEYLYYDSLIPYENTENIRNWRTDDPYYANNIDLTGKNDQVHWRHFFEIDGYDSVGLYEGAMMYKRGIWRSEQISCMWDNRRYFNAPSREAIVYRIMEVSGEGFELNKFVSRDRVKKDDTGQPLPAMTTKGQGPAVVLPPLAPPIMIDNINE